MLIEMLKSATIFLLLVCLILVTPAPSLMAEDHVLSSAGLHQALVKTSYTRQSNVEKVQKFLSSDTARKVLEKSKIESAKIEKAVPLLSDDELQRLASQTQAIEKDIAAGTLTNEQITYILIALATAVIVLILVAR